MAFTFNNFKGVNDNSSDKQVNKFYKEAIKSIRDSGDKHIIFLEAIQNPENLENPNSPNFGKNKVKSQASLFMVLLQS